MNARVLRLVAATLAGFMIVTGAFAVGGSAQTIFYNEVPKDGRIYVFASGQRYDAFEKSGGTEIGTVITRPGYGPNGETVVFDSEDAINLYNFKHDRPGEYFPPKHPEAPNAAYPSSKFSGLMFGDEYCYEK